MCGLWRLWKSILLLICDPLDHCCGNTKVSFQKMTNYVQYSPNRREPPSAEIDCSVPITRTIEFHGPRPPLPGLLVTL